jgi:hypothetical protein
MAFNYETGVLRDAEGVAGHPGRPSVFWLENAPSDSPMTGLGAVHATG